MANDTSRHHEQIFKMAEEQNGSAACEYNWGARRYGYHSLVPTSHGQLLTLSWRACCRRSFDTRNSWYCPTSVSYSRGRVEAPTLTHISSHYRQLKKGANEVSSFHSLTSFLNMDLEARNHYRFRVTRRHTLLLLHFLLDPEINHSFPAFKLSIRVSIL